MSEDNKKTKKNYKLNFLLILLAVFCMIWVPAVLLNLHFETVFFLSLVLLITVSVVIFAHGRLK